MKTTYQITILHSILKLVYFESSFVIFQNKNFFYKENKISLIFTNNLFECKLVIDNLQLCKILSKKKHATSRKYYHVNFE
jgi:hypothetical protein